MQDSTHVKRWINWWRHFSSDFGSHHRTVQLCDYGRNTPFPTGVWKIFPRAVNQHPELWRVPLLLFSLTSHCASPYENDQRNLEYCFRPCLNMWNRMWWWNSRPKFVNELSKCCHQVTSRTTWFAVRMICESSVFWGEGACWADSILVTRLRWKTTHHT